MGKEKKSIGIKTTRYFTKSCSRCGFEYPNWFTNCTKCGLAWDDTEKDATITKESHKKTIKIVVKITEEDFDKAIQRVELIFSADQGKTWYQVNMEAKLDYYLAEIEDIPLGSVIIYYIEVYLEDGDKIIENNENEYFYYKVGIPIKETELQPSQTESQTIKDNIKEKPISPQEYKVTPKEKSENDNYISKQMIEQLTKKIQSEKIKTLSIPLSEKTIPEKERLVDISQSKMDKDLKICPHCKSKIKKLWSICPICGKTLQ